MSNLVKKEISISCVVQGMTVCIDGKLHTVGIGDLKYDSFMGYSFLGDSSKRVITMVQFAVPTSSGVVLR